MKTGLGGGSRFVLAASCFCESMEICFVSLLFFLGGSDSTWFDLSDDNFRRDILWEPYATPHREDPCPHASWFAVVTCIGFANVVDHFPKLRVDRQTGEDHAMWKHGSCFQRRRISSQFHFATIPVSFWGVSWGGRWGTLIFCLPQSYDHRLVFFRSEYYIYLQHRSCIGCSFGMLVNGASPDFVSCCRHPVQRVPLICPRHS